MKSRVKESEISYEERKILANQYASFFLVLGLFLFISALLLYRMDWFRIATLLFVATGVGEVIYKIRENVVSCPHYKEVAFHYASWIGIPVTAVVILMAILFYYGQIVMAYLLSILLVFIPLILASRVIKKYPMFPEIHQAEKETGQSGTALERDIEAKKRAIDEYKIMGMEGKIVAIVLLGILLYRDGFSLFSILIAELFLILISYLFSYAFNLSDIHVISRSYKMMSKAQKKHLFALFIFWFLLLFLILLPMLFIKERTVYELWWVVIYLAFLAYDIWYLKKRKNPA